MRIVGIAPRLSRTIVCLLEDEATPVFIPVKSEYGKTSFKRQRVIVGGVQEMLREHDIVVLEDFSVADSDLTPAKLVERLELNGMLKLVCPAVTRLPWLSALPPLFKIFIADQASMDDEALLQAVNEQWQVPATSYAEAVAFALARHARSVLLHEGTHEKCNQKFEAYGHNFTHLAKIRFFLPAILESKA